MVSCGSKALEWECRGLMFALQTMSVTGPRSNQRPTAPKPLPSLSHGHRIYSHYSALIDEPLFVFQPCTFLNLKSPFILGKRKRKGRIRRGEGGRKKTYSLRFFSLQLPELKRRSHALQALCLSSINCLTAQPSHVP